MASPTRSMFCLESRPILFWSLPIKSANRHTGSGRPKRTKSSLRLRPHEEWIPLDLLERLRLVHRDCWQRVQIRLKQNIAFSPRNEKHQYLLKGLVQCGGCGSRFVGDHCHGRFYYRFSRRCNRLPAIREYRLDRLVVEAAQRMEGAQFDKAGIRSAYYESPGTAHEFQTWRRCLHEFAPLLFRAAPAATKKENAR